MHIMSNKKFHTQSAKTAHNTTLTECVATFQFIKLVMLDKVHGH